MGRRHSGEQQAVSRSNFPLKVLSCILANFAPEDNKKFGLVLRSSGGSWLCGMRILLIIARVCRETLRLFASGDRSGSEAAIYPQTRAGGAVESPLRPAGPRERLSQSLPDPLFRSAAESAASRGCLPTSWGDSQHGLARRTKQGAPGIAQGQVHG